MNSERYQRQIVLPDFGIEGQRKLADAKVLVVGAGGLGVPVLQYLSGMGIGAIGIVDADEISLSNLQRQVLYRTDDVGQKKVEVAKEVLRKLNPEITFELFPQMISPENAEQLIDKYDLVVDCTDSIESRYVIDAACKKKHKPFVYGALYRHEGHVSVFNHTSGISYRDVYPDDSAKVDNCNEIGVLGVLPGIIGTYQVMEAVKIIAGIGEPLDGKLLVIDALTSEHHTFQLSAQPHEVKRAERSNDESWISWQDLEGFRLEDYQLLDVRQPADYDAFHDERFQNVPVNTLTDFTPLKDKELILVCNKGITTRQASALLQANFANVTVHQVKGGYSSL